MRTIMVWSSTSLSKLFDLGCKFLDALRFVPVLLLDRCTLWLVIGHEEGGGIGVVGECCWLFMRGICSWFRLRTLLIRKSIV